MARDKLTGRQEAFVQEYLIDLDATKAAIRAGYRASAAHVTGFENLRKHAIAEAIAKAKAERAEKTGIKAEDVLHRIATIATMDARSLTTHRIGSCRYCWGDDHGYQWTTPRAYDEALAEARLKLPKAAMPEQEDALLPTDAGGYGYRLNRAPCPDCPECGGLGQRYTHIADMDNLSPEAAMLYRGTKETRNGVEILMADQDKHLELLAKHLGLIKERETGPVDDALADLIRAVQGKALAVSSAPPTDGDDE